MTPQTISSLERLEIRVTELEQKRDEINNMLEQDRLGKTWVSEKSEQGWYMTAYTGPRPFTEGRDAIRAAVER